MLFTRVILSALAIGSAIAATQINERFVDDGFNALTKRQQFIPTTQTAAGDTCSDAFGDGYETCRDMTDSTNRLCYNPTAGQICCDSSWACPNGSFCLITSYCCPNGEDPATCAAENNVNITSSFVTPSATKVAPLTTAATHNTTSSSYFAPYPTHANATTVIKATGTGTFIGTGKPTGTSKTSAVGYTTSPVSAPISGSVKHVSINFGLIAAGILGLMATIF
jgi:hypothetical protein